MPRRELLTSSERLELLAFPTDEGELIRLYTLTKTDLDFVRQHRGDHNRLGIAVLMSYLRYPGRVLAGDENPHRPLIDIVAGQLGVLLMSGNSMRSATPRGEVICLSCCPAWEWSSSGPGTTGPSRPGSIRQLSKRRAGLFSRKPLSRSYGDG